MNWNSVGHFFVTYQLPLYVVYCLFVGSLRSPTSESSQFYVSFFAVANGVAANLGRMFPRVESSPNFQAAVNLQQKLAGQEATAVKVPPTVEDKKP
jgi:hypothetical protein